jgi:adenine-specific DNA-methyltransferase
MVDTVIASHFDATRRRGDQLARVGTTGKRYRYLVARNAEGEGFFLIWEGAEKNTNFTEEVYEQCAKEAAAARLKPSPYHVYARLYRYQTEGVRFYQIPDRILADFGLDLRSDPLNEAEESQ